MLKLENIKELRDGTLLVEKENYEELKKEYYSMKWTKFVDYKHKNLMHNVEHFCYAGIEVIKDA